MSRPTVSKAKTSYPIFAATFASNRPWILVVGGGGGAGRTGVKNQITAFDFSSRAPTVEAIAEIEASKDDSITCLENLSTKDGLILFAGNNSSEEDRLAARNEHLRAFELRFPKNKGASGGAEKVDGNIEFLSKTTLFTTPQSVGAKKEGYQRIIRLSPPQRTTTNTPNRRIGVIASGLAGDENEVVIFNATSTKPSNQDIIERIKLQKGQEANDLDIFTQEEGRFRVAYVTDYEVFVQEVGYDFDQRKIKGKNEHRKIYTLPHVEKGTRSKLRGVRWLSRKHLLLLANKPNRSGVELLLFHFYQDGGSIALRKALPKHVKAATDMDVALLDADNQGAYQIAIAIAAIDMSLTVYTMDYHGPSRDSLSAFHSFNSYDNVHDFQMTKVVFSPFHKPETAKGRPSTPYLRLASTSLGNTISVETFPLQNIGSRHVLQTAQSRNLFTAATYLVTAMVVAVLALLIQSLVDPEGKLTKGILPASLQNAAGQHKTFGETLREKHQQAVLNNADSPVVKTSHRIADLLHIHLPHVLSDKKASADIPSEPKALVVHHDAESDGALSTEVHEGDEEVLKKHAAARRWDELSKEEKHIWREKLSEAGMWAVGEGETILKSIFFGQLGGLVGQAAQGVLGG